MRTLLVLSISCWAATSSAAPLREGANHRLGDDSFVAAFGRAPTDADPEPLRMHTHLVYVRAYLAARPPTRPALADRRAELLGYLDDYIAKGTTPINTQLPWRSPVFIDEAGRICAVGYLIERDIGRALPERIATLHRHAYLEDIAAAMPAVRSWIDGSGFTLDELASIQPGYTATDVESWKTWDLAKHAPADGPFDNGTMTGTFVKKSLHGTWVVKRTLTTKDDTGEHEQQVVVGIGKLDRGNGMWRSYYNDGKRVLAVGPYRNNKAHGTWSFYHPSGNLAARGELVGGMRFGAWTFYYDTPNKTPFARGRFARSGYSTGGWRYYDEQGRLLSYVAGGVTVVTPDDRGIRREEHTLATPMKFAGPDAVDVHELHRFTRGGEQIYVFNSAFTTADIIYDAEGKRLQRTAGGWTAADCGWSAARRKIAKAGQVAWLHAMLVRDSKARSVDGDGMILDDHGPACGAAQPIAADRGARIDLLLASKGVARQPTPQFVRQIDPSIEEENLEEKTGEAGRVAAIHLPSFRDRPWVSNKFDQVFGTMAGRLKYQFLASEPEADGTDPDQNGRGIGN